MKKYLLTFIAAIMVSFSAMAFNNTLKEAYEILQTAKTADDYSRAEKKFRSASGDVGYDPATDDSLIKIGIEKCQRGRAATTERLTVNGKSSQVKVTFPREGGSRAVEIRSSHSTYDVLLTPSWIQYSKGTTSLSLMASANPDAEPRQAVMRVRSGNKEVAIQLFQAGEPTGIDQSAQAPVNTGITITAVNFATGNDDNADASLTNYGAPLYSSDIRYLFTKVTYNGPSEAMEKTLDVKIFKPDGNLLNGNDRGYTFSSTRMFKPGTGNSVILSGYGDGDHSIFPPGNYQMEIWENSNLVFTANLRFQRKAGEAEYLKVDGQEALNVEFPPAGGEQKFAVNTDAEDWTAWGVPTFCKVINQTRTGFTIVCDPNDTGNYRRDYMSVRAGNKEIGYKEVRITVDQAPVQGTADLTEIMPFTNTEIAPGVVGVCIRNSIDALNLANRTITVAAKFYESDGTTPLLNAEGKHIIVAKDKTISSNGTRFSLTLDVPYDLLNLPVTFHGTIVYDIEVTDEQGNILSQAKNSRLAF